MEATISNKLKVAIAGIALAVSGFVLGATGAAWAGSDGAAGSCHDGADRNHAAAGHEM